LHQLARGAGDSGGFPELEKSHEQQPEDGWHQLARGAGDSGGFTELE